MSKFMKYIADMAISITVEELLRGVFAVVAIAILTGAVYLIQSALSISYPVFITLILFISVLFISYSIRYIIFIIWLNINQSKEERAIGDFIWYGKTYPASLWEADDKPHQIEFKAKFTRVGKNQFTGTIEVLYNGSKKGGGATPTFNCRAWLNNSRYLMFEAEPASSRHPSQNMVYLADNLKQMTGHSISDYHDIAPILVAKKPLDPELHTHINFLRWTADEATYKSWQMHRIITS